jgi:alpha-beta hydrolase superfamily lysophospholipase
MTVTSPTSTVTTTAVEIKPGANPRGTVTVIAGRGEAAAVYDRFAGRIAYDAYPVRIITGAAADPLAAAEAIHAILDDPELPTPHFLVGSDAGGVLALDLAADEAPVAGVIVAGLPVAPAPVTADGTTASGAVQDPDAQIARRSTCPVHQSVLKQPENLDATALSVPLPDALTLPEPESVKVPVLGVYGESDEVVDVNAGTEWLARVPDSAVVRTADGAHDALNDRSHRSVAARIVQFLEDIKNDGSPVLR